MSTIRIMLADDHVLIRQGLRLLIKTEADFEVVGECGDGEEACTMAGTLKPDVLIMDISMPHLDGIHATQEIKRQVPSVKILGLTIHEDVDCIRKLLQAGASGYMLKLCNGEELIRAIRHVARGEMYLDPTLGPKLLERYPQGDPHLESEGRALSPREAEVLKLLAWGYSSKEIAANFSISVRTVETHKSRLMAKLGAHSKPELIRFAVHKGLMKEE
jgi:DNA-binding NarL/FixJ family response regulator